MIKHVVMWILRTRRTRVFQLVCLKTFLIFFVLLYSLDKLSQRWSRMSRTFEIDRLHDTFTMDGRPFRFISGSFHYFRAPQSKWRSIMRSMRAAGLTALSTYIEWSSHEVIPRQYRYEGHRDFEYFFQLAAEEGLYVLLRPGPFICGERDFGGLPAWLLSVAPDIVLRRNDPKYQFYVTRWFQQLFPKLQKHLYGNNGYFLFIIPHLSLFLFPLFQKMFNFRLWQFRRWGFFCLFFFVLEFFLHKHQKMFSLQVRNLINNLQTNKDELKVESTLEQNTSEYVTFY
uniref:Beta-galactosidase n=1 Tax=Cacopsylla melanoneura TaxID=428564 RepID=A0A8D8YXX3_9HEMI